MQSFDVAVIGGGPGGYVAAIRAASRGASVALVEKGALGGCCLNIGCIPTKALLHVAGLADAATALQEFTGKFDVPAMDQVRVKAWKDKAVLKLTRGVEFLMKHHKITVLPGTGSFIDGGHLRVVSAGKEEQIAFGRAIIATGGAPVIPAVFRQSGVPFLTSTEALDLTRLPGSIAIVGGGYIGCEFASALAAFGVKVTVVEMLDRIIPAMDPDLGRELARAFKKAKIDIRTGAEVTGLKAAGGAKVLVLKDGSGITVDELLVAIGRRPQAEGLGLDKVGITADAKGAVPVDDQCRTSRPGIYAVGDVTGRILLAHYATAQARVAAANCTGGDERLDDRVVPAALFTAPEIACVGWTAEQAVAAGRKAKTVAFPYKGLGRAVAADAVNGFVKIVFDAATAEVLGAHIAGAGASDLIAVCALCMKLEGTLDSLAETIFVHPTFAEGIMEAAEAGLGKGVHGAG
ncbi:MAG: dihydrolipoyl dehydrogenase [Planctomycetota bacterium]